MAAKSLISRNPKVASGVYCIRGTRMPVFMIQDCHRDGMSAERIRKFYNCRYSIEQIQAAINFRKKA